MAFKLMIGPKKEKRDWEYPQIRTRFSSEVQMYCDSRDKLKGHACVWKAGILRDHQLHAAFGYCIATELSQCAKQVLQRRGLRTLGDKPLCTAVKAALGRIALEPRHGEFCGGMALQASDFDRGEIAQADIQPHVTHLPDPFIDRPLRVVILRQVLDVYTP